METYLAIEDIAADTECLIVARINGKPYIAAAGIGRNGESIGTSSEPLLRGRLAQLNEGALSMTADERVYKVPFSIS